jgi:glucosylceramidase
MLALALAMIILVTSVPGAIAQARIPSQRQSPAAVERAVVERGALSVVSVTASADPSLGVIVEATFGGDVERLLGQGGLRNGGFEVAFGGAGGAAPKAGLIDTGGGFTVARFPVIVRSRGSTSVRLATIRLLSPERVRSISAGTQALAVRIGDRVIVDLAGVSPSEMTEARFEVFDDSAGAGAGDTAPPTSVSSLAVHPSQFTVAQLQALRSTLARVLRGGLDPELRQEQLARRQLANTIRDDRMLARMVDVPPASLVSIDRRSGTALAYLRARAAALERMDARVLALLTASLHPAVQVVQTDPGLSQKLAVQSPLPLSTLVPSGIPVISVDQDERYQQFAGLGAALTDSSAWLIERGLTATVGLALMTALFGEPGSRNALGVPALHLEYLRLAFGASGAMTVGAPYSYDDLPFGESDPTLSDFSIAHDLQYIIPAVKQALVINPKLEILANPWSPPAWMKTNDSLDNPNAQGSLLPSAFGPFAGYLVKSIEAYEGAGVPIAAITPQNEPSSGQLGTAYPGLTLPEPDEADLIDTYLRPALRAAGLDTPIYGGDLSWDSLPYAAGLSSSGVTGIAWHCYYGSPVAMTQLHEQQPGLDQIVDECSPEVRPVGTPEFLISSLRNWASAVLVWAVALDAAGGPIQPGNDCVGCTGPVTIDEQTGTVSLRTEYYQLGQVTSFVEPGAVRIGSQSQVRYGVSSLGYETATPGLDDVAFLNPDGSTVLIADDNSQVPITFGVESDGRYFTTTLPPRAMTTFVWRLSAADGAR